MSRSLKASTDVILRTAQWSKALRFYNKVLGLPVVHRSKTVAGFDTGSFCLYVEKGNAHGPVFEFLAPDVQAAKKRLIAQGCVVVEEDRSVPRCYLRDPFGLVFNIGQG
jgi:catechol 2,3-dioxygenase-like lactoylglutathione lyase family enzyme